MKVYLCYYNIGFGEIINICIFDSEEKAIEFCNIPDDLEKKYKEYELQ